MDEDDPRTIAVECSTLPRPWLVGVDVDGTLAPITTRPEQSRLAPNAAHALDGLAGAVGVMVAVVSGRPLAVLREQFEIPTHVMLLGSHGGEVGTVIDERTADEDERILETVAELSSVSAQLPGSWIEHKPLSVAFHVRESEPVAGEAALDQLAGHFADAPGLTLHRGHKVLEIAVRPMSKTIAFGQLRRRLEPATTFFIGDDESDEHVFASLQPTDVTVKVGPGATTARHRLASPLEVVTFLQSLADGLTAPPLRTGGR